MFLLGQARKLRAQISETKGPFSCPGNGNVYSIYVPRDKISNYVNLIHSRLFPE